MLPQVILQFVSVMLTVMSTLQVAVSAPTSDLETGHSLASPSSLLTTLCQQRDCCVSPCQWDDSRHNCSCPAAHSSVGITNLKNTDTGSENFQSLIATSKTNHQFSSKFFDNIPRTNQVASKVRKHNHVPSWRRSSKQRSSNNEEYLVNFGNLREERLKYGLFRPLHRSDYQPSVVLGLHGRHLEEARHQLG